MVWEYHFEWLAPEAFEDEISAFNELGKDCWELVTIHNGLAIFKREKVWQPIGPPDEHSITLELPVESPH